MINHNIWEFPFISFSGEYVTGILPNEGAVGIEEVPKEGDACHINWGEIELFEGKVVHCNEVHPNVFAFGAVETSEIHSGCESPGVYRLLSSILRLSDYERSLLFRILK